MQENSRLDLHIYYAGKINFPLTTENFDFTGDLINVYGKPDLDLLAIPAIVRLAINFIEKVAEVNDHLAFKCP